MLFNQGWALGGEGLRDGLAWAIGGNSTGKVTGEVQRLLKVLVGG